MKLWKKIVFGIVGILLLLIVALAIIFAARHHEIRTLSGIRKIYPGDESREGGAVYEMRVKGDFAFEKFMNHGGVKSTRELSEFLAENVIHGSNAPQLSFSSVSRTTFTTEAQNKDVLFSGNYDNTDSNLCIVYTDKNEGRHASVSIVDLNVLGVRAKNGVMTQDEELMCLAAPYVPLEGMNDAGVSCSFSATFQGQGNVPTNQNTDRPDLTTTTLIRMVLDYADNVDEAVSMISHYDLHDSGNCSYHYFIADSTGKSAVLEWLAPTTDTLDNDGSVRELKVHYNEFDSYVGTREENASYQWMTDSILEPGYYNDGGEMEGYDRYENLYLDLKETNGIVANEADAIHVLSRFSRRKWVYFDGKELCTLHTTAYNLTKKTATLVADEAYEDENALIFISLEP